MESMINSVSGIVMWGVLQTQKETHQRFNWFCWSFFLNKLLYIDKGLSWTTTAHIFIKHVKIKISFYQSPGILWRHHFCTIGWGFAYALALVLRLRKSAACLMRRQSPGGLMNGSNQDRLHCTPFPKAYIVHQYAPHIVHPLRSQNTIPSEAGLAWLAPVCSSWVWINRPLWNLKLPLYCEG